MINKRKSKVELFQKNKAGGIGKILTTHKQAIQKMINIRKSKVEIYQNKAKGRGIIHITHDQSIKKNRR